VLDQIACGGLGNRCREYLRLVRLICDNVVYQDLICGAGDKRFKFIGDGLAYFLFIFKGEPYSAEEKVL